MWDAEESARRGFACAREWKQRLTCKEYQTLVAIRRRWKYGHQREDWGRAVAAIHAGSVMGKRDATLADLLPNPPQQEETDNLAVMEQISRQLESQWQPPSEP